MSQASTEGTGAQAGNGTATGTGAQADGTAGTGAQADQGNGTGSGSGDQIDVESITDPALKAYVLKVQKSAEDARREAAERRTGLATLQTQFDQFRTEHETADQAAQRAETERAAKAQTEALRLTELERENRDLKVSGVVREAASTAKAFNPARVAELIGAKVALDDKGQPKPESVTEQINALRQSDPYLFKRTSSDAGRGNGNGEGSASTTDMNSVIRAAAGRG